MFVGSFRINVHSPCVNLFSSTEDEFNIEHVTALKCHLAWVHNVYISYEYEDALTFDDDVSGAFKHAKYYLDTVAAHKSLVEEILCIPLGCVFRANASG